MEKRLTDKDLLLKNIRSNFCFNCHGNSDGYLCLGCQTANILDLIDISKEEHLVAATLPCAIGDTMWCIREVKGVRTAQEGIVNEMFYRNDMKLMIVVKYVGRGLYGKKIFSTKEDCEAKIKELNEKDKWV